MSLNDSKPNLTESQASEIVKRLFGLGVAQVRPLPSYDDQNFYVGTSCGKEYVLKMTNSEASQNSTLLEIQTYAMCYIQKQGLPAQTAVPMLTGDLMALETVDLGHGTKVFMVRLLTYMPGTIIAKVPVSRQLLYDIGKMAATMDKFLLKMEHPNIGILQRENFIWNLSSTPLLEPFLYLFDGDPLQDVIRNIIELYKSQILPVMGCFRKCINHGDFNDHNILAVPDGTAGYKISAILDFGDMSSGYYIFELAITIMYMMIENPKPLEVAGPVLAGWESEFPLNTAERNSLYLLVLCRFCQSLVLGRHALTVHPENEEYLMVTAHIGAKLLASLWELGKKEVEQNWFCSAEAYSELQQ